MLTKPTVITVAMRQVRALIDAATVRGIGRDDLLRWASIDQALLGTSRARVSLKQFSRLYTGIVAAIEDEGLGLHDAPTQPGTAELICRLGVTATNLADCAAIIARGCNAMTGGFQVDCVTDGDEIQIRFRTRVNGAEKSLLAYEILLLTIYAIISWLAGERIPLLSADFPCRPPRHKIELHTLLAGAQRFNQPHAALRFPKELQHHRITRTAADITRFIRRAPGSMIESLLVRESIALETQWVLQQALPVLLSLPQVAERLAMSPRTLHRRLEAADQSFQQIKDHLRRDLALDSLTRGAAPLKQIATNLGFSDQSTFQRAFVQWTGLPPGEYRKRTRSQGEGRVAAKLRLEFQAKRAV